MSSLKQLNRSIKLKRLQGKHSARQCSLHLNLLVSRVHKQTKAHPFVSTIGTMFTVLILSKHAKRIRYLSPFASIGVNFFRQYQETKKSALS